MATEASECCKSFIAGEVLTEMAEYVKGVGRSEEDSSAQPKAESSYMGVDDADEAPAQPAAEPKQEAPGAGKFGAWVPAEGDGADADGDADMADAEEEEQEADKDEALIHEKAIGKGQSPSEEPYAHRFNNSSPAPEFLHFLYPSPCKPELSCPVGAQVSGYHKLLTRAMEQPK